MFRYFNYLISRWSSKKTTEMGYGEQRILHIGTTHLTPKEGRFAGGALPLFNARAALVRVGSAPSRRRDGARRASSRRTSARGDPCRRCGGVFAADGGGRGGDARTPQGAPPRARRSEDRRAQGSHRQDHG